MSEDPVQCNVSSVDGITDPKHKTRFDIWSEAENKIRLGMRFESKLQLKKAIPLWSVAEKKGI